MNQRNRFVIRNDLQKSLTLNIEPEGAFFSLQEGEEVTVIDSFTESPVTLKLGQSDDGESIVSIWPGDGEVTVEKGGVGVFDLIESEDGAHRSERIVA